MNDSAVIEEQKPLHTRVRLVFTEQTDNNAPIRSGLFARFTGGDKFSKRPLFGASADQSPC